MTDRWQRARWHFSWWAWERNTNRCGSSAHSAAGTVTCPERGFYVLPIKTLMRHKWIQKKTCCSACCYETIKAFLLLKHANMFPFVWFFSAGGLWKKKNKKKSISAWLWPITAVRDLTGMSYPWINDRSKSNLMRERERELGSLSNILCLCAEIVLIVGCRAL